MSGWGLADEEVGVAGEPVQLYANCPSAGIYHAYQDQVELTGDPLGAFAKATFSLSPQVAAAMQGKHSDFSLSIAVKASPAAESFVLDNLRFSNWVRSRVDRRSDLL